MSKEKVEKKADDTLIVSAMTFLMDKATLAGENIYTVKGSDLERFYKDNGVPVEIQHRTMALNDAVLAAAIDFNGEKLKAQIEALKKSNEDPEGAENTIKLNYSEATTEVSMVPHVARKIPTHLPGCANRADSGDGMSHHYGVTQVRIRTKGRVTRRDEQLTDWADTIKEALGV